MLNVPRSNGNIAVMTKTTCYFRLDRVWNIHVETTENSISSILDFKIFWGSTELHLETPRGSRLWRSQYFPLLRNIRISIRTPLLKSQLRGWSWTSSAWAELQVATLYALKILLWLWCIDYLRPGKARCKERLLTIGSFGMLHLHRSPIYWMPMRSTVVRDVTAKRYWSIESDSV